MRPRVALRHAEEARLSCDVALLCVRVELQRAKERSVIAVAKSLKKHRPCECAHCKDRKRHGEFIVCAGCFHVWPCEEARVGCA